MNEYLLNIYLKMETLRLTLSQLLQAKPAIPDMTKGLLFFPLFYWLLSFDALKRAASIKKIVRTILHAMHSKTKALLHNR